MFILCGLIPLVLNPTVGHAPIRPIYHGTIVGMGAPASCGAATLRRTVANGGVVTFRCGLQVVRITIRRAIPLALSTYIDGQGRITLAGATPTSLFRVSAGAADARTPYSRRGPGDTPTPCAG